MTIALPTRSTPFSPKERAFALPLVTTSLRSLGCSRRPLPNSKPQMSQRSSACLHKETVIEWIASLHATRDRHHPGTYAKCEARVARPRPTDAACCVLFFVCAGISCDSSLSLTRLRQPAGRVCLPCPRNHVKIYARPPILLVHLSRAGITWNDEAAKLTTRTQYYFDVVRTHSRPNTPHSLALTPVLTWRAPRPKSR